MSAVVNNVWSKENHWMFSKDTGDELSLLVIQLEHTSLFTHHTCLKQSQVTMH